MRNTLMLSTVLLLCAAPLAQAQDAAAPEPAGVVDFGLRAGTMDGDAARYERFRDLRNGAFSRVQFGKTTDQVMLSLLATNIGYRDQHYEANYTNGTSTLNAFFDSTPLNYSYLTSTPWREVQTGRPYSTRSLYTSADGAAGSWERPYAEAQNPRWDKMVAPAIPVSELVALTTPINAGEYRAYYLSDDSAQTGMTRVTEGAEVPRVKLVGGDHTIDLYKYGRGLEATYEQLKRQRLDKMALHIRRMAVQAEVDKVGQILSVMVNGDGNSGTTPSTFNLTALDSGASAGTLSLKGWLAFKMKFANPYTITGALAQEAVALQMLLLNTGSANTPLVNVQQPSGLGSFTQINPGLRDSVALGWTSDAPSLKIVGFDKRFAIERVLDIGATITEVEQFITRQTQVLVVTEAEGFAVIDKNAINILNVNA